MFKAGDFPHRHGDQSAKTQGSSGANLASGVSTGAPHNSVRTGQQSLGFRKSLDSQNVLVGNQPISPINSGAGQAAKLQGQVKTV